MSRRPSPRSRRPQVDGLESRLLLTATAHHHRAAVEMATHPALPHVITGSFSGTLTYPAAAQTSATTGTETIAGSGKAHGVATTVVGSDRYTEIKLTSHLDRNKLAAGSLMITGADGSTIAVTYSGSGVDYSTGSEHYAEVVHGTAVYTSGTLTGVKYRFTGTTSGNSTSDAGGTIKESFVLTR